MEEAGHLHRHPAFLHVSGQNLGQFPAPKRHSQPLQAMAIRDKKTYIRKRPEMPTSSTRVIFDVEGIPEREFFYLIGVVVIQGRDNRHAPVLGRR